MIFQKLNAVSPASFDKFGLLTVDVKYKNYFSIIWKSIFLWQEGIKVASVLREVEECIILRESPGQYMGKKILVVEDTEDVRQMMKIMLEISGYTVFEAADGTQAVEKTAEQQPDLILMDISMPVMDGLTATKVIREINSAIKLPIIAVTAFGKQFYSKAIEAGCNDLISKPIDFDALQPVIEHYLAF